VQLESFFDARRLGPLMPPDLLPGFDRLCAGAVQAGRLAVPCWGANTVRSEFAVLTGIGQAALGLDRFNPYERFAQTPGRSPLRSLAWEMKGRGYRTICLHPFDKRFYARASVMPKLGFDEFRGLEAFTGAARSGPYVSDRAVGEAIAGILRAEGPAVFVFAMTMGNHGPWGEDGGHPPLPAWAGGLDGLPEAAGLRGFLAGLAESDAMLAPMMEAMPPGGVLAVYGDHQPSLPAAFAALGLADESTDYAIWQAGLAARPVRRDIAAEDLAQRLLRHLSAARGPVDRAGDDLR
jgi:phosphoglycerol transferase MdoB-like AlkP superfamily enzyme